MVQLAHRYHRCGWLLGTSGNLSALFTGEDGHERIVVTASGQDKGALHTEAFVEMNLDGTVHRAAEGHKPSAEASIHLALYGGLQECTMVLHVHTVASSLALPSAGQVPGCITFQGLEMLKGWGLWEENAEAVLPVFANHAHVPEIADAVRAYLRTPPSVPALLIAGHGLTAWGRTYSEAHRHVEITEFMCRVAIERMS